MNTIFHVLSGQLHVICKYTPFPVIQTCNTFQKKLGQEQFRASNEVNWLNNDVIWNRWCQQVIVIMILVQKQHPRKVYPLGAKMGRGSQFANKYVRTLLKCVKQCSQRKMGRFGYFTFKVHNIIKRFRNLEEFQCVKDKGASLSWQPWSPIPQAALH